MTEIAFHFNAPDKAAYACRLLRKATASGARVVVTASADVLARLDVLLWTFSQTDFVAHVRLPGKALTATALQISPVVLTGNAAVPELPHHDVLLNLGDAMPEGFADYARVIEVVSLDEADRQQARIRWKSYAGQGYAIQRHDLKLAA
jgi:DNA polymerase-3 subunit chi